VCVCVCVCVCVREREREREREPEHSKHATSYSNHCFEIAVIRELALSKQPCARGTGE
jgi:hypothetical protein